VIMDTIPTDPGAGAAHELLGLPAGERDPVRIVEAAACRLRTLESAGGSETAVRRSLARLIRSAREEMLRAIWEE
jgi:hypothetical protein